MLNRAVVDLYVSPDDKPRNYKITDYKALGQTMDLQKILTEVEYIKAAFIDSYKLPGIQLKGKSILVLIFCRAN